MDSSNSNIAFLVKEYEKLKDEQNKRIEFRDHMIYLTLGAIGAVFSFSLEKPEFNSAFLILPFICIVLGWTYLSNDEKISSIGKYIRDILLPKIDSVPAEHALSLKDNWDAYVRKDRRRRGRKQFQLLIDLSIYCFSAFISIIAFFIFHKEIVFYHYCIISAECILIIYLTVQFVRYADMK